ncbi:tetratricopeptide repeat protein [Sphingomonas sp. PAMC 26617]|uniref:tetratricopeptide repeat protein n=1 Tax=Sphingomonas sp. PAMC 26617 TaxID=1112216 RepID=UPI000289F71D|nr:tetratricopeptide repeat protein [Sphingomonas sp. PAMC 26617]
MRQFPVVTILLAATMLGGTPALAQSNVEGRVGRLESEMRAVQRKVFPGGAGAYVEPDNVAARPQAVIPGTPAASPVADLTARVDSLEAQLRQMTGQVETNQHRIDVLEGRLRTIETNAAARAADTPPAAAPGAFGGAGEARTLEEQAGDRPAPANPRPSVSRPSPDAAAPTMANPTRAAAVAGDTQRTTQVASVERPETGDPVEDTYLYGYRLWTAKRYAEAETQFKTVTTKYPKHKRASYAQNLLGRSYLEDGKPSLASLAFYDSYKTWPDGDRAPESLFYLAQALVKLDKPAAQVCKVYTELQRTYGAKVDADPKMKAGVAKGRAASNCS